MKKILQIALALTLALAGTLVLAVPAHAACGDTTAEWVDPLLGSTWSGTVGSDSMVVTLTPALNLAASVVVGDLGLGVWVHDYDTRWSSSLAGIWEYHFEVNASSCHGGKVTAASGGATDGLFNIFSVSMTRTG